MESGPDNMVDQPANVLENKAHPWKPGTMVRVRNTQPLYRLPTVRVSSTFLVLMQPRSLVMYVDCDGPHVARMVKVIYGEIIGWTYRDAVTGE